MGASRPAGRCHANLTAVTTEDPAHGTRTRYTHHGCRCPDCRQANADYQRLWRSSWRPVVPGRWETSDSFGSRIGRRPTRTPG